MSQTLQFRIDEQTAGSRLDHFLAAQLGGLSRMRIANLIAEGACLVNGQAARPGYHLAADDLVEITIADGPPTSMDPEPIPLEIIYEDSHILVVVKPSGMLVHPTKGVKRGTLANALTYHLNRFWILDFGFWMRSSDREVSDSEANNPKSKIENLKLKMVRPGIVHRLDRDTSGLMVIAKTQRALSILSRHFNRRLVRKRYVALVRGAVFNDAGEISAPIGRDPDSQPHWRVMESGKAAETRFRVMEKKGEITMIELEPVTGRTNQLRIHCAYAGHPILGDKFYGGDQPPDPSLRLCLHASELAFHHPAGGEWREFHSPLPADIIKVLSAES